MIVLESSKRDYFSTLPSLHLQSFFSATTLRIPCQPASVSAAYHLHQSLKYFLDRRMLKLSRAYRTVFSSRAGHPSLIKDPVCGLIRGHLHFFLLVAKCLFLLLAYIHLLLSFQKVLLEGRSVQGWDPGPPGKGNELPLSALFSLFHDAQPLSFLKPFSRSHKSHSRV